MAVLSRDQILSERNRLHKTIQKLDQQKVDDLDNKVISVQKFREINAEQLTLENLLNQLNIKLVDFDANSITVANGSPASKINTATSNLNDAINTLNEIRRFLDTIAVVIDAVTGIIGAIVGL